MRQWVLSFPFLLRFLFATRQTIVGQVLGIVYRVIATHLIKKVGQTNKTARTGMVALIQRFGGVLNLNVHFHMLLLDGVCIDNPDGSGRFRCGKRAERAAWLPDLCKSQVDWRGKRAFIRPIPSWRNDVCLSFHSRPKS